LVYKLTRRVDIDFPVRISGAGRSLSLLLWVAAGGGIHFDAGMVGGRGKRALIVEDLGLRTSVAQGGRALEVVSNIAAGNIGQMLDVSRCDFYQHVDNAYWTCGLYLENIRDAHITDCDFRGREGGAATGTVGLRIGGALSPTTIHVTRSLFTAEEQAIRVEGLTEGVTVEGCTTIGIDGVVWATDLPRPLLVVSNSHFDTEGNAIDMGNCTDAFIHHCLVYPRPGGARATRAGVVVGAGCEGVVVSECKVQRVDAVDNVNGVIVAGGARNTRVVGGIFEAARTGVWLA
jgi:hypothetical protein